MSWDAYFYARADGHLVHVKDWNYTHNTNRMINTALGAEVMAGTRHAWWDRLAPRKADEVVGCWWDLLDGASGEDGSDLLGRVLTAFAADPDRYRQMNPDNGWGSFDRLRIILRHMRWYSLKFPSGEWRVSG